MWPVGSSRIPGGENIPDLQQAQPIEADQRYLLSKLIYGDVAMIFAFTSIAVLNTLIMIARRRGPEFALLRPVGATTRQVRSMARWEAILIITIGLGIGLAIAATALLPAQPRAHGRLRPRSRTASATYSSVFRGCLSGHTIKSDH